ncbi:MAG TPA: ComF family protein [Allosphingosinicella sp.]|jgi:ComF family protein
MSVPAAAIARAALRQVIDFALPPRCPGCADIVGEPHRFCLSCWQALGFLGEPCCARCGLPFAFGQEGETEECGRCLADPPPFERLRAAVSYGEMSRKVALKLKYGGRPGVAETLAGFMLRHLSRGEGEPLLVPVPLHRWRIWKRGYNQAALITSAISRRTRIPAELDLLRRTRATPPLRGLGRRERALAVRGAFALAPGAKEKLQGCRVILIDDVYTSGATASACAKALLRGGARSVEVLCWARVVHLGDEAA